MNPSAVHMVVHGRVQGVFYRANTQAEARHLGVKGWVRNCPDGTVEVHAEGDESRVQQLVDWCRKGPPHAHVTHLEVQPAEPKGLHTFEVR